MIDLTVLAMLAAWSVREIGAHDALAGVSAAAGVGLALGALMVIRGVLGLLIEDEV